MNARLGIYLPRPAGVRFADRMAMIRDAGFGATCLWWEDEHESARRLRDLAPDIVRANGLLLDNIHVPYRACNGLWSLNGAEREAAVAKHVSWVEDCARHDVSTMVMHATMGLEPPAVSEQGVDSFRRIVGAGEALGVTIAVENTRSVGHLSVLFEAISSTRLGLCFDTAHDRLYGSPPLSLLAAHGDRLVTTHFSDTDGKRDYHWVPGAGTTDFAAVMDAFPVGFSGPYLLEVVPKNREVTLDVFLGEAYSAGMDLLSFAGVAN